VKRYQIGNHSSNQCKFQRAKSRLKSKSQAGILGDEEKLAIRNKIDEIEKLINEVHILLDAH
jgi:hypothetical protein